MKIKKLFILFYTFLSSSNINSAQIISELVTPIYYTDTIKQKDLNQSATTIYKITRPGRYYVASDLTFTPTNNNAIGIEIAANNVVLNLNTNTLNHNSNSRTGFIMIKVNGGYSNITITNGNIISDGNGKTAIIIDRGSTVGSPVVNNLNLNYLTIRKFNTSAITESGSSTIIANGLNISNVDISQIMATSISTIMCNIVYRNNIIIKDSKIHNCSISPTGTYGSINLASCNNIRLLNINCSNNSSTTYAIEITFHASHNAYFKNCKLTNLTSSNGYAVGFNCGSGASNITLESCIASNFSGSGNGRAIGYYLVGTDMVYRKCIAKNLSNTGAIECFGFINYQSQSVLFEDCIVSNISNTNNVTYAFFDSQSTSTIYRNCIAQRISSSSRDAYGFYVTSGSKHLLENCTAASCQSTGSYKAAGIYLASESNDCILNCKSYSHYGPSNIGAGIYLDASVTRCVTIGNQLFDNTGTAQYGYYDATALTSTTNWIAKNIAYGQGVSQNIPGAGYVSTKCNYFVGNASTTSTDRSNFITDAKIQQISALDTAKTKWNNVSFY